MQVSKLKILLLQVREDDVTLYEEFDQFVRASHLDPSQLTQLNACKNKDFSNDILQQYDALFIGGSSDASVLQPDKYSFVEPCKQLLQYSYDNDIPVFASCFGFQLAVEQFGGKVILDKPNKELGIFPIYNLPLAKDDPLMSENIASFMAVAGHLERAESLPNDAILLSYSSLCPYHTFKLKNKLFYAFQFHPEMNKQDLDIRISRYENRYLEEHESLHTFLNNSINNDTTYANQLLKRFIDELLKA